VPIGLEEFHEGVVDIVSRRALRFEGAKGLEMQEGPVPDELKEEMEQRRAELVERVSEVRPEQTHLTLFVLWCTQLAQASNERGI
jgi:elongation factor G